MQKRTVIITGGNAGLGYQTAKSVAANDANYHVVLACRSLPRAALAASELRLETGNPNISVMELDLASLASVRHFAATVETANLPPLYSLVCNAGISAGGIAGSLQTVDGVETIFGVNHLGHFLLANLLLHRVVDGGRVIFVTSDLHDPPRFFPFRMQYEGAKAISVRGPGMQQYCTSKLCNLYCAYEMDRLIRTQTDRPITVNAFNPGAMSDTAFARPKGNVVARALVGAITRIMGQIVGKPSTSVESGVKLASLVTYDGFADTTGKYFDRGIEVESSPLSHNEANAAELWSASLELSGLSPMDTIFQGSKRR
jgi:NAD(P)-dependent dehydrogenase (short-subunit alcohol dehydrogenase family)